MDLRLTTRRRDGRRLQVAEGPRSEKRAGALLLAIAELAVSNADYVKAPSDIVAESGVGSVIADHLHYAALQRLVLDERAP